MLSINVRAAALTWCWVLLGANMKELIIFIPGSGSVCRELYLKKLINGIKNHCNVNGLLFSEMPTYQTGFSSIKVENKTIDIEEIYWKDLVPNITSLKFFSKITSGLFLIFYWSSSLEVWKQITKNKYMLFSSMLTFLIFFSWYYGLIATALSAVSTHPSFLPFLIDVQLIEYLGKIGEQMGSWVVFVIASLLTTLLPVDEVLDISYMVFCYLNNQNSLFNKLQDRISNSLILSKTNDYDSVTILSHSFGTIVALETIVNKIDCNKPVFREKINFVTLGSPLLILSARSERIKNSINKLASDLDSNNGQIGSWVDFYSNDDWFCTASPKQSVRLNSKEISSTVSFLDKCKGASHDLYFDEKQVMNAII
ncbi:MAG: hypothetical protein WAX77_09625 [Methylococcaceae bacterium]